MSDPLMSVLELAATAPFHAFFGVVVMMSTTLLVGFYSMPIPGWEVSPLADQATGGGIAWSFTELPTFLVLMIKPQYLNQLASTLTQHELSEDPHDFLSSYILHSTQNLAAGSLVFAALYLLSHGIVKIVLVWEILHNRFWAYLGLIYLTIGFMVYQIYRFSFSHSIGLLLLTVFDAVIVYLTTVEYRKRRHQTVAP